MTIVGRTIQVLLTHAAITQHLLTTLQPIIRTLTYTPIHVHVEIGYVMIIVVGIQIGGIIAVVEVTPTAVLALSRLI